jgi:Fe-S-cluster containining protein
MFEKYYNKLRFSQKMADKSLIACIEATESNRNHVLTSMKDKKVLCRQGCNLCCHFLTLTIDTLDSYILLRVFATIPYNELFPYYKKCIDNRIKAREYIDSLPEDFNCKDLLEEYNKLGSTVFTCPFVDKQNGCLIHKFKPQICFTYFSSVPCKIILNPVIGENEKMQYEALKDRAEIVDFIGLENDNKNFNFNESISETYDRFFDNYKKSIKQDTDLANFLFHSVRYEMLTIVSFALKISNPEKYKSDMEGLEVDLLGYVDGKINFF